MAALILMTLVQQKDAQLVALDLSSSGILVAGRVVTWRMSLLAANFLFGSNASIRFDKWGGPKFLPYLDQLLFSTTSRFLIESTYQERKSGTLPNTYRLPSTIIKLRSVI